MRRFLTSTVFVFWLFLLCFGINFGVFCTWLVCARYKFKILENRSTWIQIFPALYLLSSHYLKPMPNSSFNMQNGYRILKCLFFLTELCFERFFPCFSGFFGLFFVFSVFFCVLLFPNTCDEFKNTYSTLVSLSTLVPLSVMKPLFNSSLMLFPIVRRCLLFRSVSCV